MNWVRAISPSNLTMTVEAGCILAKPGTCRRGRHLILNGNGGQMDRLKGKVILISGGARGQGAAEARLFVTEGARVVIGDVLETEGRQLASELAVPRHSYGTM
jgi:hypothetical protein